MSPRCATCGAALTSSGPAGTEAEVGTVRGNRAGAVTWVCPHGHPPAVTADVEAGLAQVVDGFDVAARTRLRQTLQCGTCGTPFVLPGRRTTRSVTVTAAAIPATTLTFDVPLLRCTEDGVDNLPPECLDDLEAVVRTLLASS